MTVSQKAIPVQLEKLDQTIQEIFTTTATALAKETRFVQRTSPLTGARFAQALVFGWLANPTAGYTFLQSMLQIVGCDVSAQALEQRMTPQAADFLCSLLHAFTYANIASEPVVSELLNRFNGVYLQDGTVIGLPNEMAFLYQGFGGNTRESGKSALRLQVRLNLSTGALDGRLPHFCQSLRARRRRVDGAEATSCKGSFSDRYALYHLTRDPRA